MTAKMVITVFRSLIMKLLKMILFWKVRRILKARLANRLSKHWLMQQITRLATILSFLGVAILRLLCKLFCERLIYKVHGLKALKGTDPLFVKKSAQNIVIAFQVKPFDIEDMKLFLLSKMV